MNKNSKKSAVLGLILSLISGCNGSAPTKLPDGETDLSCAALIFAATNLVGGDGTSIQEPAGFGNYIAVMTKYGTAYANSNGIGANEALGQIKIEAYRMTGKLPGAGAVASTESIVRRGRACMGS